MNERSGITWRRTKLQTYGDKNLCLHFWLHIILLISSFVWLICHLFITTLAPLFNTSSHHKCCPFPCPCTCKGWAHSVTEYLKEPNPRKNKVWLAYLYMKMTSWGLSIIFQSNPIYSGFFYHFSPIRHKKLAITWWACKWTR